MTTPSASRATAVPAPWLTAGTTVAGLKLRAMTPFTIRRSKHHFGYGGDNPTAIHGATAIYEVPKPLEAAHAEPTTGGKRFTRTV